MKRLVIFSIIFFVLPVNAYTMHIMEGFLPVHWALIWAAAAVPFLALGVVRITRITRQNRKLIMLLAMAGAFTFVLSALKLPSVTGSSSHPTGVGLGTVLFGPLSMGVLGFIVLLFQALLLAHGGLTTLGANTFSMAVFGPFIVYFVFKGLRRLKVNRLVAVFFATTAGNLSTYIITSLQLSLAHPDQSSGIIGSFAKFSAIFAVTQIPIALIEGLLTALVYKLLTTYAAEEINALGRLSLFTKRRSGSEGIS